MNPSIAAEVERLRQLKTAALRTRYREVLGEESRSSNRQSLLRRIAWRLQARAEGDLMDLDLLPTRVICPEVPTGVNVLAAWATKRYRLNRRGRVVASLRIDTRQYRHYPPPP